MPLIDEGNFRKNTRSNTGRIYIPAALVRDSQFPLREGKVKIQIKNKQLIINNINSNQP